jgi:diaminobutyrate-2-oxoglutarate transaminase
VQREALRRGLICELGGRHGAVVRLLPPLILDREEADFIIRVLDEALTVAAHHSDNEDSVVNG